MAGMRRGAPKHTSHGLKGQSSALGLGRVKMFRPRETGDAKLNLACCRTCELESAWFAPSAVSDLVAPMRMPTRSPHVWIAAMRGFTPRMFMTRVRL
jgi:hypothetical protein